jgi:hypothetical protein
LLDPPEVDKPIYFGHYCIRAPLAAQSPLLACVDVSVAKGGPFAAYRHPGEATLDAERFFYG